MEGVAESSGPSARGSAHQLGVSADIEALVVFHCCGDCCGHVQVGVVLIRR